jgi:hypothetical protein
MSQNFALDVPAGTSLEDLFGPVIHAYTRAQAIEDGSLIDVTDTAREAGFRWPVALTASAWVECVAWSEQDEARKPEYTGQSEAGRLWDVLWMAFTAIRAAKREAGSSSDHRLAFTFLRIPTAGRGLRPRRTVLHLVTGPGDSGEPVVTIMCPDED